MGLSGLRLKEGRKGCQRRTSRGRAKGMVSAMLVIVRNEANQATQKRHSQKNNNNNNNNKKKKRPERRKRREEEKALTDFS